MGNLGKIPMSKRGVKMHRISINYSPENLYRTAGGPRSLHKQPEEQITPINDSKGQGTSIYTLTTNWKTNWTNWKAKQPLWMG